MSASDVEADVPVAQAETQADAQVARICKYLIGCEKTLHDITTRVTGDVPPANESEVEAAGLIGRLENIGNRVEALCAVLAELGKAI